MAEGLSIEICLVEGSGFGYLYCFLLAGGRVADLKASLCYIVS